MPEEEKKPEAKVEEKAEAAPKWVVELSAKLDKLTEAIVNSAPKKQEEEEEEKPPEEEEEKQEEEEEKPEEEEEKQEEEEEEEKPPEEEEKSEDKLKTMVESAIEVALAKRLEESKPEKRSKAVKDPKDTSIDVSMEALNKMPMADFHKLAKRFGAP